MDSIEGCQASLSGVLLLLAGSDPKKEKKKECVCPIRIRWEREGGRPEHPRLNEKIAHFSTMLMTMSRSREDVNKAQRERYAKRTKEATQRKSSRDFGIAGDRFVLGLSLRKIAAKRSVSVGCVRTYIEDEWRTKCEAKRLNRSAPGSPPTETPKSYAAFLAYIALGARRSVRKAARQNNITQRKKHAGEHHRAPLARLVRQAPLGEPSGCPRCVDCAGRR